MSRKIVHIVYSLDIGGLERVLINCINGMPEFEHSVFVLTSASPRFSELLPKRVELTAFGKRQGQSWSIFKDIYKALKSSQPDIVHTYNTATLEYQTCAFFAGVKKRIHAEHGRDIFDPTGENKKYQWLRRLMSPFVHNFVSVSEDLHLWLRNTVKIRANKTKLIYNGINTKLFTPVYEANKPLLHPKQENKLVFGCVARLAPIKDHKMLIEAFAIACRENEDFKSKCQLTIVGDGEMQQHLEQSIERLNSGDNIWLAGPRLDMPDVYRSFDWLVLSSLAEGVPMTVLEAKASGIPTLATKVGGLPEIITPNQDGLLVDSHDPNVFADQLIQVYLMTAKQQEILRKNCRNTAIENFSENKMFEKYTQIYNEGF